MSEFVTALYDFRSKQSYIYRTNKIREISGASQILSDMYDQFFCIARQNGLKIESDLSVPFSITRFEKSDLDGQVVYIGGGNLYMLYKNREVFIRANKLFSRFTLEKTHTLSLIASGVAFTGNFSADRAALYKENMRKKNTGFISKPVTVLPYTQVDPVTFLPVSEKQGGMEEEALSRDRVLKRRAYKPVGTTDISEIVDEESSDIAIIYTDGNKIGEKLKNLTADQTDYDNCVKKLRDFSKKITEIYIDAPIRAISDELSKQGYSRFRQIIGGGDEITLICNAHAVIDVVRAYYRALKSASEAAGEEFHACTGVAICQKSAPFSQVYKIAEACCKSAKDKCRGDSASASNYIDFHNCHGSVGDFEQARAVQEAKYTLRPYEIEDFLDRFAQFNTHIGRSVSRSDMKNIRDAIVKGDVYYGIELERIKAKYPALCGISYKDEEQKKLFFDIADVYIQWFDADDREDCE